jgi:hypothetical protein
VLAQLAKRKKGVTAAFMLRMILDTVISSTPEVAPEVTPEVRLLSVLAGEMTRQRGARTER